MSGNNRIVLTDRRLSRKTRQRRLAPLETRVVDQIACLPGKFELVKIAIHCDLQLAYGGARQNPLDRTAWTPVIKDADALQICRGLISDRWSEWRVPRQRRTEGRIQLNRKIVDRRRHESDFTRVRNCLAWSQPMRARESDLGRISGGSSG